MIAKEKRTNSVLWQFVEKHKPEIERAIEENLPLAPPEIETEFNEAVRYLISAGGKRLRPVLTALGAELVGGKAANVMHAAAAVEYIHTSSIVFDDLPCMDNTPRRRGKASLHEKYGEGLSALVAIGFLNQAYRLVASGIDSRRSIDAVLEMVNCIGPNGMIGGQSVDLMVFGKARSKTGYYSGSRSGSRDLQNLKTSALIRLALNLGAILSGAKDEELAYLSSFAENLGNAYQISDDLIDAGEDAKMIGSDELTKDYARHPASLQNDLLSAVTRSKTILTEHFTPCEARECLIQLVDYVATRKA